MPRHRKVLVQALTVEIDSYVQILRDGVRGPLDLVLYPLLARYGQHRPGRKLVRARPHGAALLVRSMPAHSAQSPRTYSDRRRLRSGRPSISRAGMDTIYLQASELPVKVHAPEQARPAGSREFVVAMNDWTRFNRDRSRCADCVCR
jgi:hypothetical protein